MTKPILLHDRTIGPESPPFIIAEMSGNHNQSLDRALHIVDAAAKAGAHALKLQTYTADTMTLNISEGDFFINDPKSPWQGRSLYSLYQEAHTPWEWHKPIFERCREQGMLCFSTPFDETAIDFLETLNVPCYKIASFENTDINLVRRAAATGKPLFISTGMASLAELDETVSAARAAGCTDIILLKCTSTYPSAPVDTNIRTIPHMRDLFRVQVGLSDHTAGTAAAVASIALGATVIEKHFTLDRSEGGVDAAFSLEPDELRALVVDTERAWQALGRIFYGTSEQERASLCFRRSLYVIEDMQPGDVFTKKNMRAIRPGFGLPPKYLDIILGKKANQAIRKGSPVSWDMVG